MTERIFTVTHFLTFCKTKDPEEKYNYCEASICACGQYCTSLGLNYCNPYINRKSVFMDLETLAGVRPWTWGALTERVESYLAGKPINEFLKDRLMSHSFSPATLMSWPRTPGRIIAGDDDQARTLTQIPNRVVEVLG